LQSYQHLMNEEEPQNWHPTFRLKIAVLDMNNGHRNIGIRNIRRIVDNFFHFLHYSNSHVEMEVTPFHIRDRGEMPDTSHDIYISSGGPGSPIEGEESWQKQFYSFVDKLLDHNLTRSNKKYFFGICHSFQLLAKKFDVATISRRDHRNLGIVPIFKTDAGKADPIFEGLNDKFYAFDNRDWQVKDPNERRLKEIGADVISFDGTEAGSGDTITGIRYSSEIESVQFHPEAEKNGILMRISHPDEKQHIIDILGEEKFDELLDSLSEPNKLMLTYKNILPGFLIRAFNGLAGYFDLQPLDRARIINSNLYSTLN